MTAFASTPSSTPIATPSTVAATLGALSFSTVPTNLTLQQFVRLQRLAAVLLSQMLHDRLTTYRPVARAAGWGDWGHRDRKFHADLGELSRACIRAGGGAITAIVTRADDHGNPTRPGREFYELIEQERGIKIPRDPATGEYDQAAAEQVWLDEIAKLGMTP